VTKSRLFSILVVVAIAVAAVAFAAVTAKPAQGSPTLSAPCTTCHATAASGNVTATPSTSTPAAGATYTVAITSTLTASGQAGYQIDNPAGTSVKTGGPGAATSWDVTMTAPATAGSYTYTVWVAKGKPSGGGMAKSTAYTITVSSTLVKEAITLKLNGKTTIFSIALGRSVKATVVITPKLTVSQVVKLTVQKWRPALKKWVAVKTLSTAKTLSAYSKVYPTGSRGKFRMHAVLAATALHTKATSVWRTFRVI
jgi:hypothetical protein